MQVESLGGGKFFIDRTVYTFYDQHGRYFSGAEDIANRANIDPKELLLRLHRTRESLYQELMHTKKIPDEEVSVLLANENSGFKMPFTYDLTHNVTNKKLKHEGAHEVQQVGNRNFGTRETPEWRHANHYTSFLPEDLARELESLFLEGFATIISHDIMASKDIPEIAKVLIEDLSECASLYHHMRIFSSTPHVMYDAGFHMFERIQKAGRNVVYVGMKKDPLQFIKIYEKSSEKLGLEPIVTMEKIDEIIPPLLKTLLGRLADVTFS